MKMIHPIQTVWRFFGKCRHSEIEKEENWQDLQAEGERRDSLMALRLVEWKLHWLGVTGSRAAWGGEEISSWFPMAEWRCLWDSKGKGLKLRKDVRWKFQSRPTRWYLFIFSHVGSLLLHKGLSLVAVSLGCALGAVLRRPRQWPRRRGAQAPGRLGFVQLQPRLSSVHSLIAPWRVGSSWNQTEPELLNWQNRPKSLSTSGPTDGN